MTALRQQTLIRLDPADLVSLVWSVPAWEELTREPAASGLVRHGGVAQAVNYLPKSMKVAYSEHAASYLQGLGDESGNQPRTLLAFGSRNTFQNLGLPGWHADRMPRLLCRRDEPWAHWEYHAFCGLKDGGAELRRIHFEPDPGGQPQHVSGGEGSENFTDVKWAVTGQPLVWDGVVSSVTTLAGNTYDIRHLWALRWEAWQKCPGDFSIYQEMMSCFMRNLAASVTTRGESMLEIAARYRVPPAEGYLHSSLGMTDSGELLLLMQTGSIIDVANSQRALGARRAILLDNGGSVGVGYWSRYEWQRIGWTNLRDRPTFIGNGSYFRPRAHSVVIVELRTDLPDGPTALA